MPSLIKTSVALGQIPESPGPAPSHVRWVPVDGAARVIVELLGAQQPRAALECFNIVNTQHCPWKDLVVAVQQYYARHGHTLEPIGFDEWLDALRMAGAGHVQQYPALKLLGFFGGMTADKALGFATDTVVKRSVSVATMGPVDGVLMQKWLGEWAFEASTETYGG